MTTATMIEMLGACGHTETQHDCDECGAGHWLDVMPAIPLARAVPVVHRPDVRGEDFPGGYIVSERVGEEITLTAHDGPIGLDTQRHWRVDLDDDQGFGYALRWLCQNGGDFDGVAILRHIEGETTDADRLALAKAVADA